MQMCPTRPTPPQPAPAMHAPRPHPPAPLLEWILPRPANRGCRTRTQYARGRAARGGCATGWAGEGEGGPCLACCRQRDTHAMLPSPHSCFHPYATIPPACLTACQYDRMFSLMPTSLPRRTTDA
eukprot:169329-Chlamydomonas_euryale.AAC.1